MRFMIFVLRFIVCRKASIALCLIGLIQPIHAEKLLLSGGTVHTASGETLSPGQVLVTDGKITGVAKSLSADGATTVDLTGLHLYPGMIALDTEMGLSELEAVRATRDLRDVGEFTPDVRSWLAVNPDSELLPVARANGVAYFEPAPQGAVIAGQSGLMVLTGWTSEQMAFQKPIGLHVYWPSQELTVNTGERTPPFRRAAGETPERPRSLEDQAKERRERVKAVEDFFDEASAYAKARDAKDSTQNRVPAWEAMLPYVRGELPVVIHADEKRQIESAVKWATTTKRRIILSGARDAWKLADLLATNQIPVIYRRVFTQLARDSDPYDVHFRAPEVLRKAGVKVVFALGDHAESLVKNLPYDAAQAVAFGYPADEALKGITLYPAQLAGVADRLGSIETGKVATLFASDGDILDIRSNVKRFWIGGKEVSLESRHTRLYEKYKNRPKAN